MEKVQELKETRDEIQSLLSSTTRPRIKKLLQDELQRVEREISFEEKRIESGSNEPELEEKKPAAIILMS